MQLGDRQTRYELLEVYQKTYDAIEVIHKEIISKLSKSHNDNLIAQIDKAIQMQSLNVADIGLQSQFLAIVSIANRQISAMQPTQIFRLPASIHSALLNPSTSLRLSFDVRFGSLAALDPDITLTAAFGGNPAGQLIFFLNPRRHFLMSQVAQNFACLRQH